MPVTFEVPKVAVAVAEFGTTFPVQLAGLLQLPLAGLANQVASAALREQGAMARAARSLGAPRTKWPGSGIGSILFTPLAGKVSEVDEKRRADRLAESRKARAKSPS